MVNLYNISLNFRGTILSYNTVKATLHLFLFALIWCVTSLAISSFFCMIEPRYFKQSIYETLSPVKETTISSSLISPLKLTQSYYIFERLRRKSLASTSARHFSNLALTSLHDLATRTVSSVKNTHQWIVSWMWWVITSWITTNSKGLNMDRWRTHTLPGKNQVSSIGVLTHVLTSEYISHNRLIYTRNIPLMFKQHQIISCGILS